MCGLTLLPRNVLPTIFFVLMSMNAISLESRFTIMTTWVGSGTLTSAARSLPVVHRPAARAAAPAMVAIRVFVLIAIVTSPPDKSGQRPTARPPPTHAGHFHRLVLVDHGRGPPNAHPPAPGLGAAARCQPRRLGSRGAA